MCLAIPGKILEIKDGRTATVDIMGISREAALDLLPTAKVGDYILVHAGFGIEIVDEQSAAETLELIAEFQKGAGSQYGPEAAAALGVPEVRDRLHYWITEGRKEIYYRIYAFNKL